MQFPFTITEFQRMVHNAVCAYWHDRSIQAARQVRRGVQDTGTRGEVTGGAQMDSFGMILQEIALAAGYTLDEIAFESEMFIPGFYRPQKKWDFTIVRNKRLVAAIELKSQSGSFGNNFNNRSEEAVGLARDFWIAFRERAFGLASQPWLGYFFLLEDCEKSSATVRLSSSPFACFPKFEETSYQDRYRILLETLVLERDFSATSLLLSTRPQGVDGPVLTEPSEDLSFYRFCQSLFNHLVSHAKEA